ncbi:MAG TPA: DUF4296 domain-containing protein [Puia sp.]|nr:DUF4296 domain-containing protein [Puia sp.]
MTRFRCLLFLFLIIGCSNRESIPSGVIEKKEMEKILWDMIQADQFSKQFLLKDSAKKNVTLETLKLYDQIFQLHHITKEEFQKSYQFYISRPDIFKIVIDSISAQGNRRMRDVYQAPGQVAPPKKIKTDSTK